MEVVKYSLWDLICCLESLLLVAVKTPQKVPILKWQLSVINNHSL